jgi:hypothetical protein
MTSTVTQYSSQINVNFPVAGQDNDSQGFRNNFSKIQGGLETASREITNLQVNSVSLNGTNDFGDNVIRGAAFQDCSDVVNDAGYITTSSVAVDYRLGGYQQYSVDPGTYTFNISNWPPSGKLGTLMVEVTPTATGTVSLNFGGAVQPLNTTTSLPVIYHQLTPIVWELLTPDEGSTILARQLK